MTQAVPLLSLFFFVVKCIPRCEPESQRLSGFSRTVALDRRWSVASVAEATERV